MVKFLHLWLKLLNKAKQILQVAAYYLDDAAAAEVAGCFDSAEPFIGVYFRRSLSASR